MKRVQHVISRGQKTDEMFSDGGSEGHKRSTILSIYSDNLQATIQIIPSSNGFNPFR